MLKRIFDIICSMVGLILLSPIIIILAILLRIFLCTPVIFRQMRPGLNSKIFTFYKFSTMTNDRDKNGIMLEDKDRITRFGNFLRKTSLDELPSLWNVLKGEMSLVGSRPLLVEYLDLYSPEQARRHEVKPGITGWAQVNGRNAISWEEKFKLDVWYVDNRSFWLDMKILFMTIWKVLKVEGISPRGRSTMEKFYG
ncbi:MAG: sugar transferase [Bacteroidetes bacterium]|nr:sugar transferase [Bacteroidota bacterium]